MQATISCGSEHPELQMRRKTAAVCKTWQDSQENAFFCAAMLDLERVMLLAGPVGSPSVVSNEIQKN